MEPQQATKAADTARSGQIGPNGRFPSFSGTGARRAYSSARLEKSRTDSCAHGFLVVRGSACLCALCCLAPVPENRRFRPFFGPCDATPGFLGYSGGACFCSLLFVLVHFCRRQVLEKNIKNTWGPRSVSGPGRGAVGARSRGPAPLRPRALSAVLGRRPSAPPRPAPSRRCLVRGEFLAKLRI